MNLRAWRRAKEITQAEMAERLGIHVATYQNWEKAPQNISVRNALKISEILCVPLDEIKFTEADD